MDDVREAVKKALKFAYDEWFGARSKPKRSFTTNTLNKLDELGYQIVLKDNWQPIETVPKDDTHILVYQPAFEKHGIKSWQVERIAVVSFDSLYKAWSVSHVGGYECEDQIDFTAVTHWQPLPAPPKGK